MIRVYRWHDRHVSDRHPGGWVLGSFAAAVETQAELRAVCRRAGVHRPSRAQAARQDDDVVQIALAHPGVLLFQSSEPTGDDDPHWRVLPDVP